MDQEPFNAHELEVSYQLLYMHGREGGHPPGDFNGHLIRAMMHADYFNLSRILLVFPHFQRPVEALTQHGSDELVYQVDRAKQAMEEKK